MLFTKTSALLRDLAGGRADGSWEPRLRRYLQPDVFILDDFGMREFTPTQPEHLYELICERCRGGSIITTSNRSPVDWYALFPNAVLAESALDRLVNSAHHVFFKGRTYRPLRRPDARGTAPLRMTTGRRTTLPRPRPAGRERSRYHPDRRGTGWTHQVTHGGPIR